MFRDKKRGKVAALAAATVAAVSIWALFVLREPAPPPASPSLEVEFSGCSARREGICARSAGAPLVVWARSPGELRVSPAASASTAVDGGVRFMWSTAPDHPVEVKASSNGAHRTWRLAWAASPETEACQRAADRFAQGLKARRAGQGGPADRLLSQVDESGCEAPSLVARAAFIRAHLRLAPTSTAAYAELGPEPLSEAHALLRGAWAEGWMDGESRATLPYYQGLVALETGNVRDAARLLRLAERRATRLDLGRVLGAVLPKQLPLLAQLGRYEEARRLRARIEARAQGAKEPCLQRSIYTNLAWTELVTLDGARPFGPKSAGAAPHDFAPIRRWLGAALARAPACGRGTSNEHLNLAIFHLHLGETGEARAHFDAARASSPPEDLRVWMHEVEGRLALAEGRPSRARQAFERELEAAVRVEGQRRARFGLGRASEALGDLEAATAHYRAAETLADRVVAAVGLEQGQSAFATHHSASSQALVDVLLRRGDHRGAFAAARRGRARALTAFTRARRLEGLADGARAQYARVKSRYLALAAEITRLQLGLRSAPESERPGLSQSLARAQVELERVVDEGVSILGSGLGGAQTEAAMPAAGEATLLAYPARHDWRVFLVSPREIRVRSAAALPRPGAAPQAWASTLLEPFSAPLADVRRLRVLPVPALSVDVHTLPLGGRALFERMEVVYALDLPAKPHPEGPPRAAVFADPQGNLPLARKEAGQVRAALGRTYPNVDVWIGRQASAERFREALTGSQVLHYAGHADPSLRPLGASLRLARNTTITTADLLLLEQVPARVLLFGCGTGRQRTGPGASVEGLAQALVASGAEEVLATSRAVSDEAAERVARLVHESEGPLAQRLVEAQRAIEDPALDAAAFRVWVP